MATLGHLLDLQEQLCYVQCGFCSTVLLVSVPLNSLTMVVTVKCGHCTGLLSVNMIKAFSLPLDLLATLNQNQEEKEDSPKEVDQGSVSKDEDREPEDKDEAIISDHEVLKPPEKKKRAPSAYNSFIKEEIRRLKSTNPFMSHKEAFSKASKNWAHFPDSVQQQEDEQALEKGDTQKQEEMKCV